MVRASSLLGWRRKLRCLRSVATSAKNLIACAATCSNLQSFSTAPANSAKNWIFCCRRCTAKQTPCYRRLLASKLKRGPSPVCPWKFARKSKSCANRCRTSNDRAERRCAAGDHCFRSFRLWEVDVGAKSFGAAWHHAFGFVYYQAASPDRGQWEML